MEKCRLCDIEIEKYNESNMLHLCSDCVPDVHLCGNGVQVFDDGEYDPDAFKPSWKSE